MSVEQQNIELDQLSDSEDFIARHIGPSQTEQRQMLELLGVDSMAAILRELASTGVGIVFSSHQLDLVEDVCQDVVIIDAGQVVLSGRLDELRNHAGLRYLAIAVDGAAWSPELDGIRMATTAQGRSRYIVTADTPVDQVMAQAMAAGHLTKFALEPPNLSDLFREAVRK